MKLCKFVALCALALLAVPGFTEAKKFAPTSFVAKKPSHSADVALTDALLAPEGVDKVSASNLSSVSSSRGGGIIASIKESLMGLTWYMDIIWSVAIVIFMVVWLKSKSLYDSDPTNYPDALPNFNKQVLEDGFCINREATGLGTLKKCGIADAILIIVSYFIYKDQLAIPFNKSLFTVSVLYTIVHGLIHFLEVDQTGQIWSDENSMALNLAGVGLLGLITCFTPIGINKTFNDVGKAGGLAVGIAAWIAFILFYAMGIKEKVYALTYINVTIFLSIFGARALLMGKDDKQRLEFYSGKSILMTIIAATANIAVMVFEPLACSGWFAGVGGHVWFDVTLWLFLMSAMTPL